MAIRQGFQLSRRWTSDSLKSRFHVIEYSNPKLLPNSSLILSMIHTVDNE
jgi:hypothetical protein